MIFITFFKSLVSLFTSPTAAQWQVIRNETAKFGGVCILLIAAAKGHQITMDPALQNALQYVVIICGVSATNAQAAANKSTPPVTNPSDDAPAA